MSNLYSNCIAFVMTSRVEACPFIALEAMKHQCICISTTSPPMPEIFNRAALYYKPGDKYSLANTIALVLTMDQDSILNLSRKAIKRAEQFSWDICAQETISFMKEIVKKKIHQ